MAQWRYTGKKRSFILTQWYSLGQIIEADTPPSVEFERVDIPSKDDVVAAVATHNAREQRRAYLLSLNMKELRKVGNTYGVKDTKKTELVDEILQAEREE